MRTVSPPGGATLCSQKQGKQQQVDNSRGGSGCISCGFCFLSCWSSRQVMMTTSAAAPGSWCGLNLARRGTSIVLLFFNDPLRGGRKLAWRSTPPSVTKPNQVASPSSFVSIYGQTGTCRRPRAQERKAVPKGCSRTAWFFRRYYAYSAW